MRIGKTVKISHARPLAVSAKDATVWEAVAHRAELEEAFGTCRTGAGVANILVTVAADVTLKDDLYEIVLDPQLSWLVDVHDYPWVLIVDSMGDAFNYEETASADSHALDAALRRPLIPDMPLDAGLSRSSKVASKPNQPRFGRDDRKFIHRLPDELRMLGEAILEGVRRTQPGRLQLYANVGRFVETPDNWWTIKIQPRAKSLAITVRGLPESFTGDEDFGVSPSGDGKSVFVRRNAASTNGEIELRRDRGSNSRFTLKNQDQLEPAKRVLEWAAENRR